MSLLIAKWGGKSILDVFNYMNEERIGRSGNLSIRSYINYMASSLKREFYVYLEEEASLLCKCDVPSNCRILSSKAELDKAQIDDVVLFTGPVEDEWLESSPLVYFLNSLPHSAYIRITAISMDARFLTLRGLQKPYTVKTEFSQVVEELKIQNEPDTLMGFLTVEDVKRSLHSVGSISIFANENHFSYRESRAPKIVEVVRSSRYSYDLYGMWNDDVRSIQVFESLSNLTFFNTHLTPVRYYNQLKSYRFTLIFMGDKVNDDTPMFYPKSYRTLKVYEAIGNGVIPLIVRKWTEAEPLPKELYVETGEDVDYIIPKLLNDLALLLRIKRRLLRFYLGEV